MSKENKLIPDLRFPEFKNEGEWDNVVLGEISEIVRGGSPRPIQDYITTDLNGLNWLKIADVASDSKYITETKERVIREAINSTREVNSGDLILSNSMSFGRPYILKITTCIHDGWIAIRKISNRTFEDYLYYFISSESCQSYFQTNAAGAAVKNLNAEIIKLLPIYLPENKGEQQKIASCLSSLDEVIAAHSQKLDLLKNHKKGLMQNLFPQEGETVPKYRFKEFEKDGEWVEKELSDLCFNISSGKDKNSENGEFELYGSTGIIGKTYSASFSGDYILVARVGANAGLLNRAKGIFGVTDNTLVLDLKNVDSADFIQYNLEKIRLNKLVFGSGQPLITGGQLKSLLLLTPKSEKEQQKIASCLSSLDALITAQAEKIEELKLHKKGLMQGLFPKNND